MYLCIIIVIHMTHEGHLDMENKAKSYYQILTTSGVPIYRQIIDQVKTHVATGRLKTGEFLPSVRQVANELEINPMTVSKAYSQLEKEGVIELMRGQGMAISQMKVAREDLKLREKTMVLLLREVVTKADQLALESKKVIEMLENLWKERNDG